MSVIIHDDEVDNPDAEFRCVLEVKLQNFFFDYFWLKVGAAIVAPPKHVDDITGTHNFVTRNSHSFKSINFFLRLGR